MTLEAGVDSQRVAVGIFKWSFRELDELSRHAF